MSINSYKLVPVKMFEDILNGHTTVDANRSIKSIIEDAENKDTEPKYSTSVRCLYFPRLR